MNYKEKLEKIMDILSIEDFELTRAIENEEEYETLDGRKIPTWDFAEGFNPIFEACKEVFEKPFHDVTNLTGLSYR